MQAGRRELMTVIDTAGQSLGARWQTTGGCSKTFAVESEHLGLAVACPHWQSPVRSFRWVVLPELARRSVRQSPVRSFRWVVFARTCPKIRSAHPSSHPLSLILPSDGWFLPELARNSFCSSFIPHPSSFLPTGGSCPNLPEFVLLILHPSSFIPHPSFRWVVFARTCSEVGLPIPCSTLPMGGFCPNLLGSRSAHPSSLVSLILPSDGWFLPELARKFVLLILHPSSFILHPSSLIPHPSFRRVVLARTCPEIRSAKRWLILASSQPRIRARAERRNRRSTPCEAASARRAVLSFQKSP